MSSTGVNVPGTWTAEGDFVPADGSAILRHDPNPRPEPRELESVIAALPKLGQRQDDTLAQVLDLIRVAHKLGMYDAADVLRRYVGNI